MDNTRFTVSYYALKEDLESYYKTYATKHTFQVPLSAFLSLSIVFATSDFKDVLFLNKEQVEVVFYMIYIFAIVWLIVSIIRLISSKTKTLDSFCTEMMENAITKNFEATCLFLIKKYDDVEKTYKLLCFNHIKSNSMYLPYVLYDKKKSIASQLDDIKMLISYRLGIPREQIEINYMPSYDMWYQRFSERKNCIVTYDNKVFSLVIKNEDSIKQKKTDFNAQGRTYKWVSFESFKDDTVTSHNNRDVISLLEKSNIFLKIPFSFDN